VDLVRDRVRVGVRVRVRVRVREGVRMRVRVTAPTSLGAGQVSLRGSTPRVGW